MFLIVAVIAAPLAIVLFAVMGWNHWQHASEFNRLVEAGQAALANVHREPSRGRDHVPHGIPVATDQEFPLSGPHWPTWVDPGFYERPQANGELIHSLEHGMIIIHYDRLSPEAEMQIREWTERFDGDWSGVLAVPHRGLGRRLVLTAWQHRLDLDDYEAPAMAAFIDAYRGRGPENPVR
jgi:hypothetical protein